MYRDPLTGPITWMCRFLCAMRQRHPHSKNMSCGNIAVRGLVKEIYFDVYSHIFTLINFKVSYSNVLGYVTISVQVPHKGTD